MKIIGHRGALGLAPENTLSSLSKGLEHKIDGVEFDLRVTSDNKVILNHDPFVLDPAGGKLTIKDHTLAELRAHKPDLATFEEALKVLDQNRLAFIEVKPQVPTKQIIQILKQQLKNGWPSQNLFLLSFSFETLAKLHKALPDLPVMVLEKWSAVRAQHRARKLDTVYLNMGHRWLWWGLIQLMNSRGWKLHTYTLNNPQKASKWAKRGLYGIVTDYPDLFQGHTKA